MTLYRADVSSLASWGNAIERELDLVQLGAADPNKVRTFPAIGQQEFMKLTGASAWQWKMYSKRLKEAGELSGSGGHSRVSLEQLHAFMDENKIRPRRPEGVPRAIRIAFVNFKGGSAKSTTTLHVAQRLAIDGYRVLVIDLDGQATLTRLLALQPDRIRPEQTIAAAIGLHEDEDGDEVAGDPIPLQPVPTFIDGLHVIPASMSVTSMDMELMNLMQDDAEKAAAIPGMFRSAIEGIDANYDFVLMDFQPSFSLSQTLILRLADSLLMPVPTEAPDFAGTGDFLKLSGKWLGMLDQMMGAKQFDPVMVLHVRSKLRGSAAASNLSEKERRELEEQMRIANSVFDAAGKVFGVHRPMQIIEDRPAISACLAKFKSVYEGTDQEYNDKAIKAARLQFDAMTARILEAVQLRWAEVVANGGDFDALASQTPSPAPQTQAVELAEVTHGA